MVVGAREVAKTETLYFMTITCTGGESVKVAEKQYLSRTNKLLTALRTQAKRAGKEFYFAAVTERQKRGHPHSHYLISYVPKDAYEITNNYDNYCASVARVFEKHPQQAVFSPTPYSKISLLDFYSEWLVLQCAKVGLGLQCRISIVDSVEACSRYVAKYLFKQTNFDVWPRGWRRVRYSNNWPKLEEKHNHNAFAILSAWDWYLAADSGTLVTLSRDVLKAAIVHGLSNVQLKSTS